MGRYTWFGRYYFQTPTIPVSDNAEPWRGRFAKSSPPRRLSKEGTFLGDKRSLEPTIRDITGIPSSALRITHLSTFITSERESWVRNRETKYEEDIAYLLLRIFNVHLQLFYGEGPHGNDF